MATLKKIIQSAPKMRGSLPIKAKKGAKIKKAQSGEYLTQEGNNYTSTKKVSTANGPRYYEGKSMDMNTARRMSALKGRANSADSIPKARLNTRALEALNQKNGGVTKKAQAGVKVPVKRKVDYPGYRPPRIPSDSLPKNEESIRNIKKLYDDGVFDGKKSEKPVKAKDGKWMQKAAASIKKRGTAGKCTPITKPGCTGKAKTLAKTFKAIAKKNKK